MKKVVIVAFLLLWLGCVGQKKEYTEEESLEIARKFVSKSPTYTYDGEGLRHTETQKGGCDSCWVFTFTFTSRSAGYGDRTGQMVAQVITPHTAGVTVEYGKVTRAVLDEQWDMIDQEMVE